MTGAPKFPTNFEGKWPAGAHRLFGRIDRLAYEGRTVKAGDLVIAAKAASRELSELASYASDLEAHVRRLEAEKARAM